MFAFMLAVSLSVTSGSHEPPPAPETRQEPPSKPSATRHRRPSPAIPEEAETKPAKGDKSGNDAGKAVRSGHGPDRAAEKPEADKSADRKTSHTAEKPTEKPPMAGPRPARRALPKPSRITPAEPSAAEARAAQLEAENARLRMQLAQASGAAPSAIPDAQAALQELLAGNQRFVAGNRVRTLLSMQDAELRAHLAKGQSPFAVIITCSDSRLADNLIFDQELGRLFTIREAGNCPDVQSLASVEYALEHLGSKIVVVMGHGSCGAVKAVSDAHGNPMPGNLWALQSAMAGLLEAVAEDPNEDAAAHMDHLIETNARRQAQVLLDRSDVVREKVAKGQVKVVAAVYDLASGRVRFLSPLAAEPAKPASHAGGHAGSHAALHSRGTAPAAS